MWDFSGATMLNELCGTHSIVAVQEHWLREDELDKFALINNKFSYHAASGMNKSVSNSITVGRPYGGTGFLWHHSLNSNIQFLASDADGRCIVIKLTYNNTVFILFNVYFPCFCDSSDYRDEISSLSGFVENVLSSNSFNYCGIIGDTNFDLNPNNAGFNIFNSFLLSANLCACDV